MEIRQGLESSVDVSVYADPKFSPEQMVKILEGLEEGLDVCTYTNPKFNPGQMHQILEGLREGLDVSDLLHPDNSESIPTLTETENTVETIKAF